MGDKGGANGRAMPSPAPLGRAQAESKPASPEVKPHLKAGVPPPVKADAATKMDAAPIKVDSPVKAVEPVTAVAVKKLAQPAAQPAVPAPADKKSSKGPAPRKQVVATAKPAIPLAKAKVQRKPGISEPVALPPVQPSPSLTQLKEKIMATANTTNLNATTDYTKPMADALGELQSRAKSAYEKGTVAMTEVTEFTKGNVEAMVESTKIVAGGLQGLGKSYVEEAKTAYETMTADVKEMAAVKSPTELFQLQGRIARRNFDAMVAASSRHTDAFMKLANEAFAPITGRVNLAAEKLSSAA